MARVGLWFLLAGIAAIVPSLLSWRAEVRVFHSGALLLFTAIALLTCRPIWRRVGLFTALLGLGLAFFSNIYVVANASRGLLPFGWEYGVPGISHSATLAVGLVFAQTLAFALALWLLTRPDFRAACGLRVAGSKSHLLLRGVVSVLAASTLLSFVGLPTAPGVQLKPVTAGSLPANPTWGASVAVEPVGQVDEL